MPGTLPNSPGQIVRQWLIDQSLAYAVGTAQWASSAEGELTEPEEVITVYTTQGITHARLMPNGENAESEGVQIRVRSFRPDVGWLKANAIRQAMSAIATGTLQNVRIDSVLYLIYNFARIGQVLPLGKETGISKRSLFTVNATVVIRQRS